MVWNPFEKTKVKQIGSPVFRQSEKKSIKDFERRTGRTATIVDTKGSVMSRVPSGGGGGSSGSSSHLTIQSQQAQRLAEQKRIQDQIKKVEDQKQADIQETARQEQIYKGTIAGQLQAPPSAIGLPSDEPMGYAKLGYGGAFVASAKKLYRSFIPKRGGVKVHPSEILKPFDRTVTPKGAEEAFIDPRTGGIMGAEHLTKWQKSLLEEHTDAKVTTYGQILKGKEKEFTSLVGVEKTKLEKQLFAGDITLGKAQEQFATKQEEIFKEVVPQIKGIRAERISPLRGLVDIGLMQSPITAFAMGAYSSQQDPLKIDIRAIKEGEVSIAGAITQRPSIRTTTFLTAGTIGVGSAMFKGGRAVELADVEQALKQAELAQKGFRIPVGKKVVDITGGYGVTGRTIAMKRGVTVSELVDEKALIKGTEQYLVVGKKYFSGKPYITGGIRDITGKFPIVSKVQDTQISVGLGKVGVKEKASFEAIFTKKGFVGEARLFPEAKFKFEPVGGLAQRKGEFITSVGGKVEVATIDVTRAKGITAIGDVRIEFPIEAVTKLKIITPKVDSGVKIFKPTGQGKTPFATTFQEIKQIPIVHAPPVKFPTSSVASAKVETGLVGIPRMVGGEGLTESQLAQVKGTLAHPEIVQRDLIITQPMGIGLDIKRGMGLEYPTITNMVLDTKTIPRQIAKGVPKLKFKESIVSRATQLQMPKIAQKELLKQMQEPIMQPPIVTTGATPIGGWEYSGFPFFPPIPSLFGTGRRAKPIKRKKARVPIRPSFTGIITGFEPAGLVTKIGGFIDIGITPWTIRGLETGFDVPKRKKKVVKKKKKPKTKKKK